jgi:DNA-binding FadR family transcriptional regulator
MVSSPKEKSALTVERVQPSYVQVAEQLRDAIVQGQVKPGDQLPIESELSALFGVSRSTTREALRLLSSQHLVSTRRGINGGTFVNKPNPEEIEGFLEVALGLLAGSDSLSMDEVVEARGLLEIPAARLAARRATTEQIQEMEKECAAAGLDRPSFEHDRRLHELILDASGNRLLGVMSRPMFVISRGRVSRDAAPRQFWLDVRDDHRRIVKAIAERDEEKAGEEMRTHLACLAKTYGDLV